MRQMLAQLPANDQRQIGKVLMEQSWTEAQAGRSIIIIGLVIKAICLVLVRQRKLPRIGPEIFWLHRKVDWPQSGTKNSQKNGMEHKWKGPGRLPGIHSPYIILLI
jgi:hypothetical protein